MYGAPLWARFATVAAGPFLIFYFLVLSFFNLRPRRIELSFNR